MIELRETEHFSNWLSKLRDGIARARIAARIQRLAMGNPGDVRPIGEGLSELRIDHGPGYRVSFVQHGAVLIILLCGEDKGSQSRDIRTARQLARDLKDEDHDC